MKKLCFLVLAAAGLLLGACSSNDAVDEGGNPLVDAGVGYFKVNINLPTVPVTRAWEEKDQLDDGKDSEYAVDDVTLILFGGESEDAAKVVQVNQLTSSWTGVSGTPNQVTTKHEEVVTLTAAAAAEANLYALAVINAAGIIDADGLTGIKINGTAKSNATLADIRAEVTQLTAYSDPNKFINTSGHIFMTNAVLSNTRGGTSNPTADPTLHVLAPVSKLYIYETKAAAESGTPATDIYVERGLAKVTIDETSTYTVDTSIKIDGSSTPTATFEGWCLDNINSRSYIVRKVPAVASGVFAWNYCNTKAGGDKYRFIGFAPVDAEYSTASAGFRTYWALDPNYDASASSDLKSPATSDFETTITENKSKIGNNNPLYCYENTFDVDRQMYSNTTSVVLKVTLSGGTFFTVGADRKTLYPESSVATLIANSLLGQGDFLSLFGSNTGDIQTPATISASDLDINWNTTAAGNVSISDITIKASKIVGGTAKALSSFTGGSTLLSTVQAQVSNIKRYVDGATYYAIRIQHFGNDLTPWNSGELSTAPAEATIDKIYPGSGDDRNGAYLGRYSVVRNNWYDLKITGISKIGAPTPELVKVPDHPDDELEDAFIKARINILSWAKRPQNWNLK